MLIKDPYLESGRKEIDIRSNPIVINQNTSSISQPVASDFQRHRAVSGG